MLKNNKDVIKHANIHIPRSQSHSQNTKDRSYVPLQFFLLQA